MKQAEQATSKTVSTSSQSGELAASRAGPRDHDPAHPPRPTTSSRTPASTRSRKRSIGARSLVRAPSTSRTSCESRSRRSPRIVRPSSPEQPRPMSVGPRQRLPSRSRKPRRPSTNSRSGPRTERSISSAWSNAQRALEQRQREQTAADVEIQKTKERLATEDQAAAASRSLAQTGAQRAQIEQQLYQVDAAAHRAPAERPALRTPSCRISSAARPSSPSSWPRPRSARSRGRRRRSTPTTGPRQLWTTLPKPSAGSRRPRRLRLPARPSSLRLGSTRS